MTHLRWWSPAAWGGLTAGGPGMVASVNTQSSLRMAAAVWHNQILPNVARQAHTMAPSGRCRLRTRRASPVSCIRTSSADACSRAACSVDARLLMPRA